MTKDHGTGAVEVSGGRDSYRVPDALAALWERARPRMVERLEVLQGALRELEQGGLCAGSRDAATREAHKLAGSLGTYGLMGGSEVAREVERRLEQGSMHPSEAAWLRTRVHRIDAMLDESDATSGTGTETPPGLIAGSGQNPSVSSDGATRVQWDKEQTALKTGNKTETEPETETPSTVGAAQVVGHKPESGGAFFDPQGSRGSLADLIRGVLEELVVLESMIASRVRETGRRGLQVPDAPDEATRSASLERARSDLLGITTRLERVGLDRPARQARVLANRFTQDLEGPEVGRAAQDLLGLVQSLTRWKPKLAAPTGSRPVWVVSMDRDWRETVGAAMEVMGHEVVLSSDPHDAALWMQTQNPAGLVLDVVEPGSGSLGLPRPLLDQVRALPAVVVVEEPDVGNRVHAARAGAGRVLERSTAPGEIVTTLEDLVETRRGVGGRVLVVDDDETIATMVQEVLGWHGHEVTTAVGAHRFWDALESCSPQLVVMDLNMPGLDGVDLCLALRTDPRWENLSVIFLSTRDDETSLRRVFEAGADDFVPKPVDPEVLVTRVHNRLARKRSRMVTGHLDPVTRLPAGPSFADTLKGLVDASGREHGRFTLGVVRLDSASRLRRTNGYRVTQREEARLARVLSGRLEAGSLLGRLDMDRFIVGFDGLDLHDAKAVLQGAIGDFETQREGQDDPDALRLSASAGVAQRSVDGLGLEPLLERAETARRHAEQAGGSRVYDRGGPDQDRALEKVDVLVVDDDSTIGHLLLETLTQKGWKVAWEPKSQRAVKRLAGQHRDLSARVVLLDVNMPDMDGLSVLRLLAQHGVVPETRVIMLTVRAREDEVVRALNLGASDHVAKPFSIPVLVSRVKRALGE